MPIKFRCTHCRQFLGISRSKAGAAVDCPTCGRTVRVPNLDGTVDPLQDPGLDLQDSRLSAALDQLARLGAAPAEEEGVSDSGETLVGTASPKPLPAPAPIDPPRPVEVARPPVLELPPAAPRPIVPPAGPPATHDLTGEIAALAKAAPKPPAAAPSAKSGTAVGRAGRQRNLMWLAIAAAAMLLFAAGFATGRWTGTPPDEEAGHGTSSPNPQAAPRPAEPPGLFGRVTVQAADGTCRPDPNARLIALPRDAAIESKLSATAFHSAPDSAEFRDAAAALQQAGGDVAVADERGEYRLALQQPGDYWILCISHYEARDGGATADSTVFGRLADYFDRPERLLGARRYELDPVRFGGDEAVVWDHSFQPPS